MTSKYKRKIKKDTLAPDYARYQENLYGKEPVRGDKLAFDRSRAELKRREDEASTSRERNSLLRESAEQIRRHEQLTGITQADWDRELHLRAKNLEAQC